MSGPPPLPIEEKKRRGTYRRDRDPGARRALVLLPAVTLSPDGPLIEALVTSGAAVWIGPTDMPIVRLAQRLWDDAERLRAALDVEFSEPAFRAYRDLTKELIGCLSLLGLTPADRSRLGVAEVKTRSKLEEIMDRRAERKAGRRAG